MVCLLSFSFNFPLPSCCSLPSSSLLFLLIYFVPHCSVSLCFYFRPRFYSYLSSLLPVYIFFITISLLLPVTRIFSFPFFSCFIFLLLLVVVVFSLWLCTLSSYSTVFDRLAVTRYQKLPSKTFAHLEHGSSSRDVHIYLRSLLIVSKEVLGIYCVLRQTHVERA